MKPRRRPKVTKTFVDDPKWHVTGKPHSPRKKESYVQSHVVDFARDECRMKAVKLSTVGAMGIKGRPDYWLATFDGRSLLIEFKAEGEVRGSTQLQLKEQAEFRALGFDVFVCDNVDAGKALVTRFFNNEISP